MQAGHEGAVLEDVRPREREIKKGREKTKQIEEQENATNMIPVMKRDFFQAFLGAKSLKTVSRLVVSMTFLNSEKSLLVWFLYFSIKRNMTVTP